jgi:hypothetical protein
MVNMRQAVLLVAVVALLSMTLALAGCLQKISSGSSLYGQDYKGNMARTALFNSSMAEYCKPGSCWCMVCKNGTNLFGPLTSLIGGSCFWDKNCTPQQMSKYMNYKNTGDPSISPRQFMLGQGPTFGDFASANTMCTDRLTMSVQWLIATNATPYTLPDVTRSMCFLSKDIIPVYILYSNGSNINATRAEQIGTILGTEGDDVFLGRLSDGPVGPVIVVTEMEFNVSRAGDVADQVRAIDRGCRNDRANNKTNCFIAVAPRMNDFAALDAVMNNLSADADKVDLVAYGINGKNVHSCDGAKIRLQASNFSSYALYNWSKPSLIAYVLFDPGTNDTDNSCTWTESNVVSAYGGFLPWGITALQKRGVIGIAPYSYNTTGGPGITNPLNCTDCGVGRTPQRLQAWYGGCQAYSNISMPSGDHPSASTYLLFGNESGTACNANTNFDYMRGFSFAGRDMMQQMANKLRPAAPLLFTCDACLLSNASRLATDMFPSLAPRGAITDDKYCKSYPEIEQWASARNLDPMLVRAFVMTESGFDPCAAARVCREGYDDGKCFQPGTGQDECYGKPAYDEIYDPAGNCTFDVAPNVATSPRPDWRYCAFGLMQAIEPPFTFWPASKSPDGSDGPYFDIFDRSGFRSLDLTLAKSCNPSYNPFTPSDSICLGTAKLEQAMLSARAWVSSNHGKLNWPSSDIDKDSLFTAYVAGNKYAGFWDSSARVAYNGRQHPRCPGNTKNGDCWAYGFSMSWVINDTYCSSDAGAGDSHCENGRPIQQPPFECYGYTDFMQYVHDCEVPFLPRRADPGKEKVEAFLQLSAGCSTYMCPDGKKLFQYMEKPLPLSGTPYLPDAVAGTSPTPTGTN